MARKSGNHVGLFLHEDELATGRNHATYMNFVVFLVKGFPCKHNQARPVAVKKPLNQKDLGIFQGPVRASSGAHRDQPCIFRLALPPEKRFPP